jgi:hypothetical protein
LNVSAETLLEQAGLLDGDQNDKAGTDKANGATERAIRADRALTESQRRALLTVYRSYVEHNTEEQP